MFFLDLAPKIKEKNCWVFMLFRQIRLVGGNLLDPTNPVCGVWRVVGEKED